MDLQNAVIRQKRDDRDRLRRTDREVVKHATIRHGFSVGILTVRLHALGQPLTRLRMSPFTEAEEFHFTYFPFKAQPFGTYAEPFTGDVLSSRVVIADAEMLAEVILRVSEAQLRIATQLGFMGRSPTERLSLTNVATFLLMSDALLLAEIRKV